MKSIQRILSLMLLVLISVCIFAGCANVPKDDVEINVVTSKGTYRRDENVTDVFLALDVLNGKERAIKRFELDATFYMTDGTTFDETIKYEKEISYARSTLVRSSFYVEGRLDHFEIKEYRIEYMNYWKTFGKLILYSCISFLVIGILFAVFMAADMSGALSVGAAGVVLFDVAMLLFLPFAQAIILILASALAFIPMLIYHFVSEY